MEKVKTEFILHWVWSIVFGLLVVTGLALLGPKYGWVLNYNLGVADYIHRTMAVTFTVLTFIEIMLEIKRLLKSKYQREPWLVVGKSGFALVTFIASVLLIISGILLWVCVEDNHSLLALAAIVHEMVTFAMIIGITWHIYDKSYTLIMGGNPK